ncbi:MAG TPA: hypothetical protein VMZ91_04315, partial [Candidatus Paceibacterota bacterium]|nr:hypothetical protein [Candidatus Paceibacterota bacterium]
GDTVTNYILENNRNSLEESAYESESEYYREKVGEFLKEIGFSVGNTWREEFTKLKEFDWEYLSQQNYYEIEEIILSLEEKDLKFTENSKEIITKISDNIRKYKYFSLNSEQSFRKELLEKAGYSEEIDNRIRMEMKESSDSFTFENLISELNAYLLAHRLIECKKRFTDLVDKNKIQTYYSISDNEIIERLVKILIEDIKTSVNLKGMPDYIIKLFLSTITLEQIKTIINLNISLNYEKLGELVTLFYKTYPDINKEYKEILDSWKEKKELDLIFEIISDYSLLRNEPIDFLENEELIDLSKSDLLQNIINKYMESNIRDKNEVVPKMSLLVGINLDKRQRANWVRTNTPFFLKEYSSKDNANKIMKLFGGDISPEKTLENYAKKNRVQIESFEILEEGFFGINVKNKETNEEFFIDYPLPRQLNTWVMNRCFFLGESIHDALTLFYDDSIIDQPGLVNFVMTQEFSTPNNLLGVILRNRGKGISEGKIIPGKKVIESLSEGQERTEFPDNRQGIFDYIASINFAGVELPIDSEIGKGFFSTLTSQGYSEEKIVKFLKKIKLPEVANILPVVKQIENFTFKILEKTDPLGSILGDLTGCCQTIKGVASDCVVDGYVSPDAGFLAVLNEKNKVVAQSWIRLGPPIEEEEGKRVLYLDNIETTGNYSNNK